MHKAAKKLLGLALSLSLLVVSNVTTVSAATSIQGWCNGMQCFGYIETDSNSAKAKTTCAMYCNITAAAEVYYWFGVKNYYSSSSSESSGGGTVATATKKLGGADVIGGRGTHSVVSGANSWGISQTAETSTGETPDDAIYL